MSGLISKAKEGLAKSKSKADLIKSPTSEPPSVPKIPEIKKSENELHWEELVNKMKRPLCLCDLDFTDLNSGDEVDVLGPVNVTNGVPPPPPPMAPSPTISKAPPPPPPARNPPPMFGVNLKSTGMRPGSMSHMNHQTSNGQHNGEATQNGCNGTTPPPKCPPSPVSLSKKNKKTVKLFWKEVRDDPIILSRLEKNKMIWDELAPVVVDTQKLEHLFESRAKDVAAKVGSLKFFKTVFENSKDNIWQ